MNEQNYQKLADLKKSKHECGNVTQSHGPILRDRAKKHVFYVFDRAPEQF